LFPPKKVKYGKKTLPSMIAPPAFAPKATANTPKATADAPKATADASKATANDPKATANDPKATANASEATADDKWAIAAGMKRPSALGSRDITKALNGEAAGV
jgi:hypothetical protein